MPAAVKEEDVVFMFEVGESVVVKEDLRNIDSILKSSGEWGPGVNNMMRRKEGETVEIKSIETVFRSNRYYPGYRIKGSVAIWIEEFFIKDNIEIGSEEELLQMLNERG